MKEKTRLGNSFSDVCTRAVSLQENHFQVNRLAIEIKSYQTWVDRIMARNIEFLELLIKAEDDL